MLIMNEITYVIRPGIHSVYPCPPQAAHKTNASAHLAPGTGQGVWQGYQGGPRDKDMIRPGPLIRDD